LTIKINWAICAISYYVTSIKSTHSHTISRLDNIKVDSSQRPIP